MNFLYQIGLIFFLPFVLFQRFVRRKFRGSLLQRFGYGFPKIDKGSRPLIWLHAVSLGETKAIATLAKRMKEQFDNPCLIISSMTETGHHEAKKAIPFADAHVYLPFDLFWVIRPIVKRLAPDFLVLSETDFWLNLILSAKRAGAKVALVNGKLSEKTTRRYLRLKPFTRNIWNQIDLFCVQSKTYQTRFEKVGVPKDRVVVTGNLKFDKPFQSLTDEDARQWRAQLGIQENDPVITIGSTHDPEEKILLKALSEIEASFPRLKIILAPRIPERFDEVERLLIAHGMVPCRFSKLKAHQPPSEKIILIDRMGLLDPCYRIADLAIVGGSYTEKVGGHNILEPCAQGTPVIFGPFMYSQPDLGILVSECRAGKQVSEENLVSEIHCLLSDKKALKTMGLAGISLMKNLRGSTDLTLQSILSL